jgi:hypothetical protein
MIHPRIAATRIAFPIGEASAHDMLGRMKDPKPVLSPDDIELVPDAWDRFVRAVKTVAKHPPVAHPTGHGKASKKPRSAVVKKPRKR